MPSWIRSKRPGSYRTCSPSGRVQYFQLSAASAHDFQSVNRIRALFIVQIKRAADAAPSNYVVAGYDAVDRLWLSTFHRIDINFLIGRVLGGHAFAIRRDGEAALSRVNALGRDGLRLAAFDGLKIKLDTVAWLISRKNKLLAIRQPIGTVVRDDVVRFDFFLPPQINRQ